MKELRIIFVLSLGILIVTVGVYYLFYSTNQNSDKSVLPSNKQSVDPFVINFNQIGNIVNTDPLKSSIGPDFSLLYEKPGSPALKKDLIFTKDSKCNMGEGFEYCSKIQLQIGDRVIIKGIEENNKVKVIELIKTS